MERSKDLWDNLAILEDILNAAQIVVLELDEDGCVVKFNSYLEKVSGYKLEEVKGKNWFNTFMPPQDRSPTIEKFKNTMRTSKLAGGINSILAKNGQEFLIEWHGQALPSPNDKEGMSVITFGWDITERQKREEKIGNLASFPELSPNPICVIGKDNDLIYRNPSGKKVFGEKKCLDKKEIMEIRKLFASKGENILSREVKVGDGWFLQIMHLVIDSGNIRIYSTNITERKEAEDSVRESETKYRLLFDNMISGFAYCKIILDKKKKPIDLVYIDVNTAFEKIVGLKRKDVVGKKVTEIFAKTQEENPELLDFYGRVALTGKEEKREVYFKALGLWLYLSVYSPQRGYFAVSFEDISERKLYEEEQKRAQEKLNEQTLKYKTLFEGSADAVLLLDLETEKYVDCNPAALKMFEIDTVAEFCKYSPPRFSPAKQPSGVDSSVAAKEVYEKALKAGFYHTEWVHKRLNGEEFFADVSISFLEIGGKKFLQGTLRDITEQKKAAQEIKSLSLLPGENPAPVLRIAEDEKVLYSNKSGLSFLAQMGSGLNKPAPRKWADLAIKALSSGKSIREEESFEEKTFLLKITPIKKAGYANLYIEDISGRKKAEEKIRSAAQEWKNTFDSISDLIFILDCNHTILRVNKAFAKTVNMKPQEIIGMKCHELLHKSHVPYKDCPFECTKGSRESTSREIDDPEIGLPLFVTTSPVFNEKKDLIGCVHIARDISEIKKAEKELKSKVHDLEIFQKAAIDRELKMIELKKRIKKLEGE